jgi:acyl transferase domain-containing protein
MGHPSFEEVQSEPIAVIGFSFRYPRGANTDDALWKMMLESVCASSDIPEDRMNIDAFYHPDGKRNSSVCEFWP